MKIIQIGNIIGYDFFAKIKILSDDYLLDADIIIIDLHAIYEEFEELHKFNGGKYIISKTKYENFITKIKDRASELRQYLKNGGSIFLSMLENPKVKFNIQDDTEKEQEAELDFLTIVGLDAKDFTTKKVRGNNIIFPEYDFEIFFNNFFCSYEFIYQRFIGRSIGFIKATNQPVAICIEKEKGSIILLPKLGPKLHDDEDSIATNWRLRAAILEIDSDLKWASKEIKETALPGWCKNYLLGEERQEMEKLSILKDRELEIKLTIEKQNSLLKDFEHLKILMYGTGSNLEIVTEKVFIDLGYEILSVGQNRDDLIIKKKDEIAVIEIKGVKGSAAESHSAQLTKWTNNYHLENNIEPKGILIVNAFKDSPLEDRKEKVFPNQMLPYSKRMEFCLISSITLLAIYLDYKSKKLTKDNIHALLFKTIGELTYKSEAISKI